MTESVQASNVRESAHPLRWISTAQIEMEGLSSEADFDALIEGISAICWDSLVSQGKAHLATNSVEGLPSREEEGIRRIGQKFRELILSCTFADDGNAVLEVHSLLNVESKGRSSADKDLFELLCAFLFGRSGSPCCILHDAFAIDDREFLDAKLMIMNDGELEIHPIKDFFKLLLEGQRFDPERFAEPNAFEYSIDSDGVAIVSSKESLGNRGTSTL